MEAEREGEDTIRASPFDLLMLLAASAIPGRHCDLRMRNILTACVPALIQKVCASNLGGRTMRNGEEPEKSEAEKLEKSKFENWIRIKSAVGERITSTGGLKLEEIPSRSLLLRKSEFPASTVSAAISLDGQRVDLEWAVRERIGGLVKRESDTFQVRLGETGSLYFTRKNETFSLDNLTRLIVSLADRF